MIIGEIGAGKSSLLSAMTGQLLYIPQYELEKTLFGDSSVKGEAAQDV